MTDLCFRVKLRKTTGIGGEFWVGSVTANLIESSFICEAPTFQEVLTICEGWIARQIG